VFKGDVKMTKNIVKNITVNNALGISDEREHEICKRLHELTNRTEVKQIASLIQEIETWDESFSRIEKSYALFLLGEAVGRKRDEEKKQRKVKT
jgi:hypothetical protein